jgi:CRISPR-associated endoribonuclease Cas6
VRIRIIFRLRNKGATLPFQHQHLLAELINRLLYNKPAAIRQTFYNYSGIKGQTKVTRGGLAYFSSRVTLVVSSLSQTFIDTLLQELFKHHLLEIGNAILTPEYVEQEVTPDMKTHMKYVCISPLVPTSKGAVLQDEPLYQSTLSDWLYDSTMTRMEKSGLFKHEEIEQFYKFQFVPDVNYLHKLERSSKTAHRSYFVYQNGYPTEEIVGYTLPFDLFAHPKVQHFIFNCGLGEYTQEGYGMIDLAHSDHHDRVVPYRNIQVQPQENGKSHSSIYIAFEKN